MRPIKFRGKRADNGKWVYGDSIKHTDNPSHGHSIEEIIYIGSKVPNARKCGAMKWKPIVPATIGQFTGLTDCNGKEIYEGDILVYGGQHKHIVEFKHGMFGYTLMDGWFLGYGSNPNFTFNPLDKSKEHEVIGNIYDNPELLK